MSNKANKRLVLVDVSHMAYMYLASDFEMTYNVNGQIVDTKVANGVVKAIWRWSRGGFDDVIVCYDSRCQARKDYMTKQFGVVYKERRISHPKVREGLAISKSILDRAGVATLHVDGFEADDLIGACVSAYYDQYESIDVVTSDFDLAPLVDDKVSVFMRSRRMTSAEFKDIEKSKYVQLRPDNFSEVETWSKFKNTSVPYNTIALEKMLQGDTSDGIPGILYQTASGRMRRVYSNKKYNALLEQMLADGVDLGRVFRYTLLPSFSMNEMVDVLKKYIGDNYQEALRIYGAIDINIPYTSRMTSNATRGGYRVGGTPCPPSMDLVSEAGRYGIHIKLM